MCFVLEQLQDNVLSPLGGRETELTVPIRRGEGEMEENTQAATFEDSPSPCPSPVEGEGT